MQPNGYLGSSHHSKILMFLLIPTFSPNTNVLHILFLPQLMCSFFLPLCGQDIRLMLSQYILLVSQHTVLQCGVIFRADPLEALLPVAIWRISHSFRFLLAVSTKYQSYLTLLLTYYLAYLRQPFSFLKTLF